MKVFQACIKIIFGSILCLTGQPQKLIRKQFPYKIIVIRPISILNLSGINCPSATKKVLKSDPSNSTMLETLNSQYTPI